MGDVVTVDPRVEVTDLGEGVVLDFQCDAQRHPLAARVRFERGPHAGVWYALGTLRRLRDLEGRAIADPVAPRVRATLAELGRGCQVCGRSVPEDAERCESHARPAPRPRRQRREADRTVGPCTFWHECQAQTLEGDALCALHRHQVDMASRPPEPDRRGPRTGQAAARSEPASAPAGGPAAPTSAGPSPAPRPEQRSAPRLVHLRHLVLRGWIFPGPNARAVLALAEVHQLQGQFSTLKAGLAHVRQRLDRLGWLVGERAPVPLPPLELAVWAPKLAKATRARLTQALEAARLRGHVTTEEERWAWAEAWLEGRGYDPRDPREPDPGQVIFPRDVLDLGLREPGDTAEVVARALAAQRAGYFEGREAGLTWLRVNA